MSPISNSMFSTVIVTSTHGVAGVTVVDGVHVEVLVVVVEILVDVGIEIDQDLRIGIQVVFQQAFFDCSGNGVLLGLLAPDVRGGRAVVTSASNGPRG